MYFFLSVDIEDIEDIENYSYKKRLFHVVSYIRCLLAFI